MVPTWGRPLTSPTQLRRQIARIITYIRQHRHHVDHTTSAIKVRIRRVTEASLRRCSLIFVENCLDNSPSNCVHRWKALRYGSNKQAIFKLIVGLFTLPSMSEHLQSDATCWSTFTQGAVGCLHWIWCCNLQMKIDNQRYREVLGKTSDWQQTMFRNIPAYQLAMAGRTAREPAYRIRDAVERLKRKKNWCEDT